MRRKSKKTKEEPKESSSERRSKRSSTRRKRAYEDDEGGSGVEEGRTTEEEMTPTKAKDRGGRRYATRGRRQKAEESEDEEVSQGEEEQVDLEEESSNNLPKVTEPGIRENETSEDYKGLKSEGAIPDKSIASEGNDGASAWKSDKHVWGMKSNKDNQEDRGGIAEETPAQGEGDDGEEEGSRSHSRKRKLKLSRECLQENREAIPKIRLRLSRNRSGGYETEKLEAERIESKKAEEGNVVKVIKLKDLPEEKEPVESGEAICKEESEEVICKEPTEEAVQEEETEEVICKEETEEPVCKEETEEPVCKEETEETVCKEETEETVCKEDTEEVICKESTEEVIPKESTEEGVCKEDTEEAVCKEEPEEVICKEDTEEAVCQEQIEEAVFGEQVEEDEPKTESPEAEQEEPVEAIAKVAEISGEEEKEEEGQQASSKEEDSAPPSASETAAEEEKADEVSSPMEEKEQRTELEDADKMEAEERVVAEEAESSSASPVEKEKEEEMEEKSEEQEVEPEKQVETANEAVEERMEENQEKQVSEAGEVSDKVTVEEDKEAGESRASDSEKPKEDEREGSDAEVEMKVEPEEVVEESVVVKVEEMQIKTEEVGAVNKDKESSKGDKAADCDEDKQPNEGASELMRELREEEQEPKSGSGERAGRINRSKLRQDDDAGEELQNQKRRRRRRSSSGSEHRRLSTASSTSEVPQPKRVTLKRPRLIRSTSSVSAKDTITEEETVQKEELVSKIEEDKEKENQPETPTEEMTQEVSKLADQSAEAEELTKRRRRKWGQQKSQVGPSHSKRAFISISTQSLKGLIPEVKPLPIHELRLSVEKDDTKDICMEEEESCEASMDETIVRMIDTNGQNERTVWAQVVDDEMRAAIHPEAPRVPVLSGGDGSASAGPVRRISIVSDDATRLQRSPSPPRHPPSSVLFLSNLVRPFTVQQLKELLARTGTVVEDGFWIDRIKSMCLVQYETEEQARETRHALHGVRWPISNPKRLWVDFATKERLEEAKREGNVPPPPPTTTGPSLTPPHPAPRDDFPRKTEPLRVDGSGMVPIHHPVHRGTPSSPGRQGHAMIRQQGPIMAGGPVAETAAADNVAWQQRSRPRADAPPLRPGANAREFKLSAPVREWDLDKVVQQSPPRAGMHGPNRGPVDERRRPEAPGQPTGRRDRMLPSPPPSMQEIQARKAKRKEAEAAAAAAAEAPANLLDSLFRKTKATPSIYWLPLTAEQIKVKEEIRRQHLAEHERRMAEMKRAAEKERGGRRRRRSSSPRRRSRRRSGEGSSAIRKKPSESMKGHKTASASPKK